MVKIIVVKMSRIITDKSIKIPELSHYYSKQYPALSYEMTFYLNIFLNIYQYSDTFLTKIVLKLLIKMLHFVLDISPYL